MTMSQAATEPQAGPMSLSNGCDMDAKHLHMEPMDLSAGPAMGDGNDDHAGQLCRRSTRVSALKAAEKIKLKDDVTGQEPGPAEERIEENEDDQVDGPPSKKSKIADPKTMDQMSHTFYIQEQPNGTVVAVEEESDISSINSADAALLRQAYEKAKAKEPSEETVRERQSMIKQLEAELRNEESQLTLMRKIQTSQVIARQSDAKKQQSGVSLNGGGAYKPTVAAPKNGSTNNNKLPNNQITNDAIKILLQLSHEQQKEFIIKANKSNPQVVQQLITAVAKGGIATPAQLQQFVQSIQAAQKVAPVEIAPPPAPKPEPAPQNAAALFANNFAKQTPQQRAAQARAAFRQQADKQLQQLTMQKSAHADLQFIPNPNQADFPSLVALDIIVQRILKDKIATADVMEAPYECEECHTDFTPSWKAIGVPGDMHLYCEACVRASQKKKNTKDHTNYLKKAFNKVTAQEKEFEKQISDGKLEQVLSQYMQQQAMQASTSSSAAQNLSLKQNGTSTPTPAAKPTTASLPATAKIPSASSTSTAQAKKPASSSSNAGNMSMTQMQLAMLMRNPMMAAVMSNPMAQMYNPMMMQMMMQMSQMQQQASRGSSNASTQQQQNANYAMILAQMAANASGSGGSNGLSQAQLTAMAHNPQLQRQLQEMMRQKAQGMAKK